MSYIEFLGKIRDIISEKLGEEYSVISKKVLKNNSVELDSLMISKVGDSVIPNIYLNQYYLEFMAGKTLDEISDTIISVYHYSMKDNVAEKIAGFRYDDAEEKIVYRLVNYSRNRELLKTGPYMRVMDLAVIFYYLVTESENGMASIRITYDNIGLFKVTPEELPEIAKRNTEKLFPPVIDEISEILIKLMEKKMQGIRMTPEEEEDYRNNLNNLKILKEETDGRMYVLTSQNGSFGATCLLYDNILERIHEIFETDFYILPSSVNEVILLRKDEEEDMLKLEEMVEMVNAEHVPEEEVLSEKVYVYPECCFTPLDLHCSSEESEE